MAKDFMIKALEKSLQAQAKAQGKEMAAQIVYIIEQARAGQANPCIVAWEWKHVPPTLKELCAEHVPDGAAWMACIPADMEVVPFMMEPTWQAELTDGTKVLVG